MSKLATKAESYVKSVLEILRRSRIDGATVIAFGSYAKGGIARDSDVDLLISVSDSTSEEAVSRLDSEIMNLESRHGYTHSPQSLVERILYSISRQTGMFVSHFICRRSDLLNLNFAKIFTGSHLLANIIAPRDIVGGGLLSHARTIYGQDLLPKIRKPRVSSLDLTRSLLMNLVLSTSSAVLALFSKKAVKYALEAVKWSLYARYYYIYHDSPSIDLVAHDFLDKQFLASAIAEFLRLRESLIHYRRFLLLSPLYVIRIHLSSVKLDKKHSTRIPFKPDNAERAIRS
jgi:predicted nucleotidyltransferase